MISLKKLLKESDDFDMTGNAHKRIGPDTKKGFSPTPVFGKKNAQGEPEDDEKSDADKKLDVIPLQESENLHITAADRQNVEFMKGVKQAVKDKAADFKRDLTPGKYMPDFVRGYTSVKQTSWWDKANDWLTQKVAAFGNSYGNRR
jgi:hypothetical protein